jgi:hypothetical protein
MENIGNVGARTGSRNHGNVGARMGSRNHGNVGKDGITETSETSEWGWRQNGDKNRDRKYGT